MSWLGGPRRTVALIACSFAAYFLLVRHSDDIVALEYNYPPSRILEEAHKPLHRISPQALPPPPLYTSAPTPAALWTDLIPHLNALLATKVISHEDSVIKEWERCPNTYLQANQDQLKGDGLLWEAMTGEELEGKRKEVAHKVVERLGFELGTKKEGTSRSDEEWRELFGTKGRGLVFTAGNKDTATRLLTSLRILRTRLGCTLPAEVWGFPHEINALGAVRDSLEALGGVTFREITSEAKGGLWKQFQIKGEAIARSSFSEVLYLDSDNIPIRDPTFLFDSPSYLEHGVVLWPDFSKDAAANPIWRALKKKCDPTEWQIESGQLLINKFGQGGRNLVALLVSETMQADFEFWFKMSGGDKDTFRFGFYFVDIPYTRAPHYLSAAGAVVSPYEGAHQFCGHTMLQYGLSAKEWEGLEAQMDDGYVPPAHAPPLFVHANLLKHSGYNNGPGTTFKAIKYATPDTILSRDFSTLTNDIRNKGFPNRGLCADIWDAKGDAGERSDSPLEGAYESGRVAIVMWDDAWGGVLRNFESMYYEEGGQAGAW